MTSKQITTYTEKCFETCIKAFNPELEYTLDYKIFYNQETHCYIIQHRVGIFDSIFFAALGQALQATGINVHYIFIVC